MLIKWSLALLLFVTIGWAEAKTTLIFINGITNTRIESYSSSAALSDAIKSYWASEAISNGDLVIKYHHNPTAGFFADGVIELIIQAMNNETAQACAKQVDDSAQPGDDNYVTCLGKIYQKGISTIAPTERNYVVYKIVREFSDKIINLLHQGNKVIVVAHSQGNYISEATNAYLRVNRPDLSTTIASSLRFVGVATLSASFPGEYTSLSEDRALTSHSAEKIAAGIYIPMLPRKLRVCGADTCYQDLLNLHSNIHGFREIYLASYAGLLSFPLKRYVSDLVRDAYRSVNNQESKCGTVSSPQVTGQQGPFYFASVGQPVTFSTSYTSKAGATVPVQSFTWNTSPQGVDAGGPNQTVFTNTFTSAGTETVSVTPVLADGTVCTESKASSQVTVVPAPKPTAGLVGHWSFDSCDARDSGPNGLHGTKYGAPVCVAGKSGSAYRMNGTSDWFTVPAAAVMPTTAMTISYWINREGRALGSFENYISKELSFQAYLLPNGTSQFGVWLGVPGFWTGWGSPLTVLPSLTEWVHYTFTYDNITRIANTYINGMLVQSFPEPDARAVVRGSGHPMFIGRNGSANVYHIKGLIDEVRIYNRALTSEEVGLLAR